MSRRPTLIDRLRAKLAARYELCFPTPIETRLVEILGGTTLTIGRIRKHGRPMTLIVNRGRLLRSEKFRRAALDGMGVLANDVKWAIAIQGPEYERDVVTAYERDELLREQGWRVRYIPARWLWENPAKARRDVLQFLA